MITRRSPGRLRLRSGALVVALLTLLLAGCGEENKGITGPAAATLPASGKVLLVAGPFHASDMGDVMEGKTQIVNDRCLGFENAGQVYVAVWPTGTKLESADSDTIIVDGHKITPSSTFSMKVSLVHQPFPKQFPELPLPCAADGLQAVAWVHQVTGVEE